MTLTRSVVGADVGVRVSGEIDSVTAPELQAFVVAASVSTPSGLGLDLSDVTFLDSSGVRVLVRLAQRAATAGTGFYLLCPVANTAVGLVLDALQLGSVMTIVETRPGPSAGPDLRQRHE